MSAIITDQLRILNARNFVSAATSTSNSYYAFVGLPNPTYYDENWNTNPPAPKDSFDQEADYWDTMVALKKITNNDVRLVVKKNKWTTGTTYDMYRHDVTRDNLSLPSGSTNLYSANYFIVNDNYNVYICLNNGTDPENPEGKPSLDEPTFTDLEPSVAGNSGDGYIWKYLYTIKPNEIIKFDSLNYIPVPQDWETNTSYLPVRNNAVTSGQIKIVTITDRGSGIGTESTIYTNVPIKGDGSGAEATVVINSDSEVESVTVTTGGSGYTYGTLDVKSVNIPVDITGANPPSFDVIIPPQGGHGYDIYRELGAFNVLVYSRIENDEQNPDFIVGNQISRIGIVENPQVYGSNSILSSEKVSALYALKLTGTSFESAVFAPDSIIKQTISTGTTAVARVVSYDQNTGVLKYWKDRTLVGFNPNGSKNYSPTYGFDSVDFTSSPGDGGNLVIEGETNNLSIDTEFGTLDNPGATIEINNKTYYLGQEFYYGVSNPEVKKYSGRVLYVDHRPEITRSLNQKEDIKVILQF
jgi:hypothetical protein